MIKAQQLQQIKKLPIKQRLIATKQYEEQCKMEELNKTGQLDYFKSWLKQMDDFEIDASTTTSPGLDILTTMIDSVTQFAPISSESPKLIEGLYAKYNTHEVTEMDTAFIQARIPLPGKPNAMITDRRGNVYVATQGKSIYQYNLLQHSE